ncbi:MAG: response regulator [Chloroflexi bacterium]|nr:MAG: two-component system response regulator [Phototrophicales bacterium]RMF76679.1 MAG: response regulator [Chloroflexota bacterium]
MPMALKRVVIIEDDNQIINLVTLILSQQGYEVYGAESGADGLDLVRDLLPDLILLDLMMVDIDGWDVYERLKGDPELQNIPVIVVTAKAQSIDVKLGLQIAKVDDYITKPFSPQQLLVSVEQVLNR